MKSTWTYQVYKKYNDELNQMLWSNVAASKSIYKQLGTNGAKWTNQASAHLEFTVPKGEESFTDLQHWSDVYNQFNNWTNLNALLAISSNMETFLSTIVSLALESDPGILFNSPKSIDGVVLLKNGATKSKIHEDIIIGITKGDWNSRVSTYRRVFITVPKVLEDNIGELEKIRNLRNKVGHAFGRDIEGSRNHEVKSINAMEKLTDYKLKKYQNLILSIVSQIDKHLLTNHIGEYQAIAYYHRIYPGLPQNTHQTERAKTLKKRLGQAGDLSAKEMCKGLVKYYEEL
jgi:hypothetical protein